MFFFGVSVFALVFIHEFFQIEHGILINHLPESHDLLLLWNLHILIFIKQVVRLLPYRSLHIEFLYFLAGFVAIHYWHLKIQKYYVVLSSFKFSFWFFDFIKCILTISCLFNSSYKLKSIKHGANYQQRELLIIDNKAVYFPLVNWWHLFFFIRWDLLEIHFNWEWTLNGHGRYIFRGSWSIQHVSSPWLFHFFISSYFLNQFSLRFAIYHPRILRFELKVPVWHHEKVAVSAARCLYLTLRRFMSWQIQWYFFRLLKLRFCLVVVHFLPVDDCILVAVKQVFAWLTYYHAFSREAESILILIFELKSFLFVLNLKPQILQHIEISRPSVWRAIFLYSVWVIFVNGEISCTLIFIFYKVIFVNGNRTITINWFHLLAFLEIIETLYLEKLLLEFRTKVICSSWFVVLVLLFECHLLIFGITYCLIHGFNLQRYHKFGAFTFCWVNINLTTHFFNDVFAYAQT